MREIEAYLGEIRRRLSRYLPPATVETHLDELGDHLRCSVGGGKSESVAIRELGSARRVSDQIVEKTIEPRRAAVWRWVACGAVWVGAVNFIVMMSGATGISELPGVFNFGCGVTAFLAATFGRRAAFLAYSVNAILALLVCSLGSGLVTRSFALNTSTVPAPSPIQVGVFDLERALVRIPQVRAELMNLSETYQKTRGAFLGGASESDLKRRIPDGFVEGRGWRIPRWYRLEAQTLEISPLYGKEGEQVGGFGEFDSASRRWRKSDRTFSVKDSVTALDQWPAAISAAKEGRFSMESAKFSVRFLGEAAAWLGIGQSIAGLLGKYMSLLMRRRRLEMRRWVG